MGIFMMSARELCAVFHGVGGVELKLNESCVSGRFDFLFSPSSHVWRLPSNYGNR